MIRSGFKPRNKALVAPLTTFKRAVVWFAYVFFLCLVGGGLGVLQAYLAITIVKGG